MPPLVIPALVASTVISTAISIASAAGAFDPDVPDFPEPPLPPDETAAAKARHDAVRVSQAFDSRRRASGLIGGGTDEDFSPKVGNATILG